MLNEKDTDTNQNILLCIILEMLMQIAITFVWSKFKRYSLNWMNIFYFHKDYFGELFFE